MSGADETNRFRSDDLLRELRNALDQPPRYSGDDDAQLETTRAARLGVPEIILGETKSPEQVVRLTGLLLDQTGSALISRVTEPILEALKEHYIEDVIEHPPGSRMVRIQRSTAHRNEEPRLPGRVAILTAGTSDVPYAHEVRLVVEEMKSSARIWPDMGVAGLHRLIQPFREAIDWDVEVFVVLAGMDGALPSVVSGLSPIPVIGLPTSVGYGFGGNGEAALMAMLQTCAPGLTVVNIDNTVGAGIAAARIARQSAR